MRGGASVEADNHEGVVRALRVCLKPIAECLLQAGISFREFEQVSRAAFAETAFEKFGLRGRATNVSRVAAMTGISRKELTRLRAQLLSEPGVEKVSTSPAGLVLAGWYTDKNFTDEDGNPLPLILDGEGTTFASLVKRYAGDVPAGAVRAELKRACNIEELEDGRIKAIRRHFVQAEVLDRLATSVEVMLAGLATTITHNTKPNRTEAGYIERFVYSDRLKESAVPKFRMLARERAQQLLEQLDDWLAENDVLDETASEKPTDRRVGLGVFYYEGPNTSLKRAD